MSLSTRQVMDQLKEWPFHTPTRRSETMLLKVTARFSSTFFFFSKLVVCVLDRGTQDCFCTRFVNLPAVRSDSSDTGNQCTTDVNDDDDDDDNNNNNNNYYYYYY